MSEHPLVGERNTDAMITWLREKWDRGALQNLFDAKLRARNIASWGGGGGGGGGGIIPHEILGNYHSDTLPSSVAAGSLIYGNATPAWAALAHPGGANQHLETTAADVGWKQDFTLSSGAKLIFDG